MKVLFLRPHSTVPACTPPLGVLSLTSYIRKYGGHEATIFDGRVLMIPHERIKPYIEHYNPDIVGITAMSAERNQAHELAELSKELFPKVPVVIGGPYTTAEWNRVLADKNIDYAVIGEGESTLLNLLKFLEEGNNYPEIKGLAFRKDGIPLFFGFQESIADLDSIPMVAWDAIDLELYIHNKKKRCGMNQHCSSERVAPVLTTRGCPYQCSYCHNMFGKKLRQRSAEHVMNELIYLKRNYDIKEIDIIDDIFNFDKARAMKICGLIIEEKLNIRFTFPNGLRTDLMDEELVDKLIEAGARRFVYPIESGSPEVQKRVKKNLNLEKAKKIIDYTASKNVSVGSYFILGFIDETEEEMRMTINFAFKSKIVTASFFVLQPFPNTKIYEQAVEAGYIKQEKELQQYYSAIQNISKVSKERIDKLRRYAMCRFYFNPWRMYRFFRTTPVRHAFWTKVKLIMLYLFTTNPEEKGALF
ncbi:B12-binding domain-containing radical SAM protein [bacterium]|nr:B12-binding domain-containing radical SAM protein [FCB group bacterium]MBL7190057.1 B12-binding domain-containing radical SAM protein [bacterium]